MHHNRFICLNSGLRCVLNRLCGGDISYATETIRNLRLIKEKGWKTRENTNTTKDKTKTKGIDYEEENVCMYYRELCRRLNVEG